MNSESKKCILIFTVLWLKSGIFFSCKYYWQAEAVLSKAVTLWSIERASSLTPSQSADVSKKKNPIYLVTLFKFLLLTGLRDKFCYEHVIKTSTLINQKYMLVFLVMVFQYNWNTLKCDSFVVYWCFLQVSCLLVYKGNMCMPGTLQSRTHGVAFLELELQNWLADLGIKL